MKNITILVGFEASEAIINSLEVGTMVELRRESTNQVDPNAIQVFKDGNLVGYVAADPKKTVLKGTTSNVAVAKNMDRPNVAGAWAKLIKAQPYGDDNKRMRWEAELYWLPVWDDKPDEKAGPILLKVGGSRVRFGDIQTVMADIDSYKGGKLLIKMGNISSSSTSQMTPVVWVAENMNKMMRLPPAR